MEINTAGAFFNAAIAAVIGFGIAFYIERKSESKYSKKSQKNLIRIAALSAGYGLTMIANELLSLPILGLSIRIDKIVFTTLSNVIFIPATLVFIAKIIGAKKEELHNQNNSDIASINNSTIITQTKNTNSEYNEKTGFVHYSKEKIQAHPLTDDEINNLYSIALDEAKGNHKIKGLWAKCFSQCDGNSEKATAKYTEERFKQLKSELENEKNIQANLNYIENLKLKSTQNDSAAAYELANIIYNGTHNQIKSSEDAFKMMMKAAYMGNAKAQHALSSMYWKGEGTNASKSNAHAWAVLASNQIADAKDNVSFFQKQMKMEEIYESDELIRIIKKHSKL